MCWSLKLFLEIHSDGKTQTSFDTETNEKGVRCSCLLLKLTISQNPFSLELRKRLSCWIVNKVQFVWEYFKLHKSGKISAPTEWKESTEFMLKFSFWIIRSGKKIYTNFQTWFTAKFLYQPLQLGPWKPLKQSHFFPLQVPLLEQSLGQLNTFTISGGGMEFCHFWVCLQIAALHCASINGSENFDQYGLSMSVTSGIHLCE